VIRRGVQLACVVGLLASSPASAQDPSEADKATARSLVFAGDRAFAEGDFTRALARYSAAYRLVRVPTVGIEVAHTEAALGQLQRARQSAQEVVGLPQKAPEPPVVERARADAGRLAAELGERIPSLTLELPAAIRAGGA
jgi:hypothetical protein